MAENIDLGIVGIKNMGEYNSQINYEKLNVVTYQGSTYCALRDSLGNLPTNTDYWQLYAERGAVGPQGPKPVKGTDYFTEEDITSIENDLKPTIISDVSDEVTSQLGSLVSATPLGVSSMSDMTDTTRIYVLETDGHWYWYNGSTWRDGGVYQATQLVTDKELKIINDAADANIIGENLKSLASELRTGEAFCVFPDWENGSIVSNGSDADTSVTSYPLSIRTKQYHQINYNKMMIKPEGFYVMIFKYSNDSSHTFIEHSEWITQDTEYTFSSDAVYRFTIYDYVSQHNSDLYWKDIVKFAYNPSTYLSNESKHTKIEVGATKTYHTLKSAIDSIQNPSENNIYDIYIDEGIYNTLEGYNLASQPSSFIGLVIPNYVNLYGVGSSDNVILKAELPIDISSYSFQRDNVSTINVWTNNIIKNMTIKAKNMRYAIHNDDYKNNAVENAKEVFEDLIVIYENNDEGVNSVSVPMGVGAYNGRETLIKNCKFIGEIAKGHSLLIHNNISSPNKCKWEIENCRFNGNLYSIGLSSAGSNQTDLIILKGSKLEKNIRYSKQSSYQSNINEYYLTGYNNVIPGYTYSNIIEDLSKIDVI